MSNGNAGAGAAGASGASGTAGASGAAAGGAGAQSGGSDWTTGLSGELLGHIQNKGFKGVQDLAESHRTLEKFYGVPQERLIKLPEKFDLSTPEGRAVFERLGAPKDPKEYDIKIPETVGNDQFAEWFKATAHKHGFTRSQAEGFINSLAESVGAQSKAQEEAATLKLTQEQADLKAKWGNAFDQNTNIAKAGARAYGLEEKHLNALEDALGYTGTMELLHKLGAATGEHEFVSGAPSGGNGSMLTPQQALDQINQLINDRGFSERLTKGDAEARKKWDGLHRMAFPG